MPLVSASELRIQFFDMIFGDQEGWLCLAATNPIAPRSQFQQKFFKWPFEGTQAENWILQREDKHNLYFCVNLLSKAERKKEYCLPSGLLWADLDAVEDPEAIKPAPTILIESSPGRYQALWRLSVPLSADIAESYSKRLAYFIDADKSGWDLTQLLRIPFTKNFKYKGTPSVLLKHALETQAPPLLFEKLPMTPDETAADGILNAELPDLSDIPDAPAVVYKYNPQLKAAHFFESYLTEPREGDDWSRLLWKQIHICLEVGMSAEEAFVVCNASAANKYARDQRPQVHLWRDILKAYAGQRQIDILTGNFRPLAFPIISDIQNPPQGYDDSFISRYKDWAVEATDAVPQFHELCAFILLSAIIATSVRLDANYGMMVPNIWGLVLGDSTLTRKTTAMRMAVEMIVHLDQEMILATDGTAEGLLTGLAERCNKTSMFFKDEVSGFFESINRRDYLAGMPETLTALYDVPPVFTRRLRKETIHIESPIFIFFGGGVREKVYEALTEEYVLSGFLPRFLVVSGEADLNQLRRTGPANEIGLNKRAAIRMQLADLMEHYAAEVTQYIGGQPMRSSPQIMANLTPGAWERYGEIEHKMVTEASNSSIPSLALPTFERLSRSLLKMAIILGAARQVPKDFAITIERRDVDLAAYYVQQWGPYSVDLITNAGTGVTERLLSKIIALVEREPGILRSQVMQRMKLTKRQADEIFGTLEDRQVVHAESRGRGKAYFPG